MKKNENKKENQKQKSKTSKFKIIFLTIILIIIIVALTIGVLFLLKKFNKSKSNDNATVNDSVANENIDDIGYYGEFDPANVTILDEENNIKAVSDELIVTFSDDTDKKDVQKILDKYDCEIVGEIYILNQYQVKFDNAEEIIDIKNDLNEMDEVKLVTYNYVNELNFETIDSSGYDTEIKVPTKGGANWHLEAIETAEAWKLIESPSKVKVGVIDSTINYNHPDLQIPLTNIYFPKTDSFSDISEFNEYLKNSLKDTNEKTQEEIDDFNTVINHGTHVTGIIAAKHNGIGISGINENADILFINSRTSKIDADNKLVENWSNFIFFYDLTNMIMNDCRVINCSFGGDFKIQSEINKINIIDLLNKKDKNVDLPKREEYYVDFAKETENLFLKAEEAGKDFLIIKSAGNERQNAEWDEYNVALMATEAGKRHTIVVGNAYAEDENNSILGQKDSDGNFLEHTDKINFYNENGSNYGNYVEIFAPGSLITSTVYDGYSQLSGTSMAAPVVAGVASLVYSYNPMFSYDQVKEIVLASPTNYLKNNHDNKVYGVINAKHAIELAKKYKDGKKSIDHKSIGAVEGSIKYDSTNKLVNDNIKLLFVDDKNNEYEAVCYEGLYYIYLPVGEKYKINLYINGDEYNIKENSEIEISSNSVIPYDITICDNDENVNNSDNEHTYKVYMESVTWEEAKARCEEMGGHLATITSEEEQKYIESINTARVWIGGYKDDDNNWKWVTGEEWNYTNWGDGEPNNSSNVVANERYVAVWPSKWNDLANTNKSEQKGFICEWEAKQ